MKEKTINIYKRYIRKHYKYIHIYIFIYIFYIYFNFDIFYFSAMPRLQFSEQAEELANRSHYL